TSSASKGPRTGAWSLIGGRWPRRFRLSWTGSRRPSPESRPANRPPAGRRTSSARPFAQHDRKVQLRWAAAHQEGDAISGSLEIDEQAQVADLANLLSIERDNDVAITSATRIGRGAQPSHGGRPTTDQLGDEDAALG